MFDILVFVNFILQCQIEIKGVDVIQIVLFPNLYHVSVVDVSTIINGKTRALFQDYAQFEQFYLLRLVTINDCILLPLRMICCANWREIEPASDNIGYHE